MIGLTHGDTLYKYTRENPNSIDWVLDSTKSLSLTQKVKIIDDNIYTTSWDQRIVWLSRDLKEKKTIFDSGKEPINV